MIRTIITNNAQGIGTAAARAARAAQEAGIAVEVVGDLSSAVAKADIVLLVHGAPRFEPPQLRRIVNTYLKNINGLDSFDLLHDCGYRERAFASFMRIATFDKNESILIVVNENALEEPVHAFLSAVFAEIAAQKKASEVPA